MSGRTSSAAWSFRRSERIDPLTANEREKQRTWLEANRG